MATRASAAAGWSTSSSSVLSDWTINGPSLTAHSSTRDRVPHQNLGRNATRGGRQFAVAANPPRRREGRGVRAIVCPLRPRAHESRRDHIGSWGSSPHTRGACRGPDEARTTRPDTRPDRPPNEGATDRPHADAPRARSPLSAIHRLWSATRPAHHRRLSVGRATVPRVGVGTSQGDVVTSIEPGSRWTERLNPRNWTLTWKLVVVGLVPALLALALGVLRIADDADQAAELGRSSRLVEVRDQVAGAANALRQERDEATLFVAGNRS